MRNLLLFFAKYGSSFLFILLEILCFYLIVNFNQSQRSIFLYSSNVITGKLYQEKQKVTDVFRLSDEVDSLRQENAVLLRRVLYYEGYGNPPTIDTSKFAYDLIPARVINQSINSRNNYMTINKGSNDGIAMDMGLISHDGLLGIIDNVNTKYARAISMLNSNIRISASIKNTGYFGNLLWRNNDIERMNLEAVPKHANITVGDSIVTSGYSTIFPANIFIGKIETFDVRKGAANYSITVKLNNDLSQTKYAYVINNYRQGAQQEVELIQ